MVYVEPAGAGGSGRLPGHPHGYTRALYSGHLAAVIDHLAVPALVMAGRYNVVCGVRWAEELHKLIPGSRLVVLEHIGHFGHLEELERFADAVAAFVTADRA